MEEERRGYPEEIIGETEPTEAQAKAEEPSGATEEKRVYVEEREVRGGQPLNTIEGLARESAVRRIRVKNKAGRVLIDIPVWAAAVGGSAAFIALPILSAVGVLGGALAGFTIEIEREIEEKEEEHIA